MPRLTRAAPEARASWTCSRSCSMKATWRQVSAPRPSELSKEELDRAKSESTGFWFHSLQATSQALQPMQIEVSVKKPLRGWGCS